MRFVPSEALLAALRRRRDDQRVARAKRAPATGPAAAGIEETAAGYVEGMARLQDEVEGGQDAFLLDPGMGPMLYLTADGRVLVDGRSWDGEGPREASDEEAIGALVVGAKKTGIDALLELIPRRP